MFSFCFPHLALSAICDCRHYTIRGTDCKRKNKKSIHGFSANCVQFRAYSGFYGVLSHNLFPFFIFSVIILEQGMSNSDLTYSICFASPAQKAILCSTKLWNKLFSSLLSIKICHKCSSSKFLNEFYPASHWYQGICKLCYKNHTHEYQKLNSFKIKAAKKIYRQKNRTHINEKSRQWRLNNPERHKQLLKQWQINNIEKVRGYKRKYNKKLYSTIRGKINSCVSNAIRRHLRGMKNRKHWENLLDYTLEDLMIHLESLFLPEMNWDNHGKYQENKLTWQIDHIRPVSSFNITSYDCQDFKDCWSLSNLQPLWAIENHTKRNKLN